MLDAIKHITRLFICTITLVFGAVVAQAQDPRAPNEYFKFTGLTAAGCGSGQTVFSTQQFRSGSHSVGTLVRAGNKTYMDENAGISIPGLVLSSWTLYNLNQRDRQTVTFPLPANTPLAVESTMFSAEYEPQWRAVAKLSKCNSGTLTEAFDYRATELLNNNSFETVSTGIIPASWTANAGATTSLSGVDCAISFPGACSLKINAQIGLKTKFTQTWTGSTGVAGDTIELNLLQRLGGAYSGGGKVKAILTFADGTSNTIQIAATGAVNPVLWHLSTAKLLMPAALIKAKVIIVQKSVPSSTWQIDGLSLATFHLRGSTLLPLAAPSSLPGMQMRGFDGASLLSAAHNVTANGD